MAERTAEDYLKAADDSLKLAKELAGEGNMSHREFLETMARSDELLDHDGETCGMCCHMKIHADVARELLKEGEIIDATSKWSAEAERRWRETKFFKLWQAETKAGRDPHKAFEARGWEP